MPYYIDFTNGSINAGNNANAVDDFSIDLRFRRNGAPPASPGAEYLIDKDLPGSPNKGYIVALSPTGITFGIRNTAGTQVTVELTDTQYFDNEWHQLTCVRSGSSGAIYIDGTSVATGTLASNDLTSTCSLYIGKNYYESAPSAITAPYTGDLMWVAIWSKVISTAEMGVRPASGTANLLLYYALTEGTGTSIADGSGNSHTGTLSGTAAWAGSMIITGTLKERESGDGSAEHYLITKVSDGSVLAAGAAAADGTFSVNTPDGTTEYHLTMPDKDGNTTPTGTEFYIKGA